jgi:hypothetical protein
MTDLFGLNREEKILHSGVRNIFTPHQPIHSLDLFLGRSNEVTALIEQLNTPGQHALLFGDRGVGKSSLANITCNLVLKRLTGGKFWRKICDSSDTFRTLFVDPLIEAGVEADVLEIEKSKSEGGNAKVGFAGLGAGGHKKTGNLTRCEGPAQRIESPGWVAQRLTYLEGLMLIDEVDAIQNENDRHRLAEVLKHLSDANTKMKILIVGIADTGSDLTAGHPSVARCLRETRLGRMSNNELREIISSGEEKLGLSFSNPAKIRIVNVSSGYPHFTHLLALKASEDAIAQDRKEISVQHVEQATQRAVDDSEGNLKRTYDHATRSHGTDAYRRIICAAAACGPDEFTAAELRSTYELMWGENISQSTVNNYFNRLVSKRDDTILRRIAKGVYRFNDPRMPGYVRIANMKDSVVEQFVAVDAAKRRR